MIKALTLSIALIGCMAGSKKEKATAFAERPVVLQNIYSFKVAALDGGSIDFSTFKGKKILIVNTASKCGYTPQYKELEQLYTQYKEKLVIVGFPANNFGAQEPGTNAEINEFCQKNYGVSFPMAAKISVKGDDIAPIYKWLTQKTENIYKWLTQKTENGVLDAEIRRNFNKFLIDENGNMLAYFPSKVNPLSEEITGKL